MKRQLPLEGRYMSLELPGVTSQNTTSLVFITPEYYGLDFVCALYSDTCTFPFFSILLFLLQVKFCFLNSFHGHTILQDCTNFGRQIAEATKFCTLAHNICGTSA
jgi:hypothetical protein